MMNYNHCHHYNKPGNELQPTVLYLGCRIRWTALFSRRLRRKTE